MSKPFTVICTSDFNLYHRWFSGEDVDAVRDQRHELGFNSVRVWTAYDIPLIGRCDPYRSGFYDQIPEFMGWLEDGGLYAEVTAFTGPYPFFPTDDAFVEHWESLIAVLESCTNLLDLEVVNECDNHPNAGVPYGRIRRPNCRSSHGSNVQDAPPKEPHWDVAGYRSPGNEWQRKVGHNAMEWADTWNIPVWTNEYPRTDNDPNLQHWYDGAASSVLLCAGAGCFHSPSGKDSTLFEGQELDCANAFVSGALSVPLEFQTGRYTVNNPPYPSGIIRLYQRTLPDGRFHQVPVHG